MDLVRTCSMRDELTKIAKTRAAKEWQAATAKGDRSTADAIAKAYGDLELAPRQLKDISTGGAEAGVDLMMGQAGDRKLPGGYIARKMYKPDSRLHRGEHTRKILEMKQQFTDEMRNNPSMREHVLDMAGHKEVAPGKFVSYHEYLPDLQEWDPSKQGRHNTEKAVDTILRKVVDPMAEKDKIVHDAVMRNGFFGRSINAGNVAMVPDGAGGYTPKIVDFIPAEMKRGRLNSPADDWVGAHPVEAKRQSVYREGKKGTGTKGVKELREAIFGGTGGSPRTAKEVPKVKTVVPAKLPSHAQPRLKPLASPIVSASSSASDAAEELASRIPTQSSGIRGLVRRNPLATAGLVGGGLLLGGAGLYGLHRLSQVDDDEAAA